MPRHLTLPQIESALGRGKSVELFLGAAGEGLISWLEIRAVGDGFELWRYEAIDAGGPDYMDLHTFSPADGEWPEDPVSVQASVSGIIQFAARTFGAPSDRWVNQSVVEAEYLDFVKAKET